jgi:20S proteasome subunit alpha 6
MLQVEELSEETKQYRVLDAGSSVVVDETIPPLFKAPLPSSITLVVHLDSRRPLSEPKWVKTGDVQEWIKGMLGRMFWAAGDAAEGWEKRIKVVDPDPVSPL